MSDNDLQMTPEEREEEERRRRDGRPSLDEEIARKYDSSRLKRIMVQGAGRGEQLDLATRSEMERLIPGHDFSSVRVFRGPVAEEITRRHNADALTLANTGMILMRGGSRSASGTTSGRALLAHELTHVAQAQRGMSFKKEDGPGDGEHEEEAEELEAEAAGADTDAADSSQEDTDKSTDLPSQVRKKEARRKTIIDRVVEMIIDEQRNNGDRRGSFGGT